MRKLMSYKSARGARVRPKSKRKIEEGSMKRCGIAVVFLYYCSTLQFLGGVQGAVTVSLPQTNYTVEESSGTSVCFRITGNPNVSSVELVFHSVGGTATEGLDYTLNSNHTLQLLVLPVIPGGSSSAVSEHCFPVFQLCEDELPENNESFTISVSAPKTPSFLIRTINFTVTIIDNDRVEVSFTRGRYMVGEGEEVEVCASTGGLSERDFVPLSMSTTPGTARNSDFFVSGVRFNRDGHQFQKCMTLAAVDDVLPEEKEFFRIRVSSSDSFVNIQQSTVKIYITDDDPVRFSLAQSVYEVVEGETATVCLVAAENDLPLIRFHLIVLDLGGNATDGDYTVHSQQSFAVGTSSYSESREICFDVATSDDDVSEGTEVETFQLLLSTEVAWVVLDMPRETTVDLVILDNDVVEVGFAESVYFTTEGLFPYLSVCVSVSGSASQPHPSLSLSTISRTAVGGSDFESATHRFELPESSYCHQLRILDDTLPELEETFSVCLTTENPLILIATDCAQVHIVDNDIPEVFWERLQYTVTESQGEVEVCAKLLGTLKNEVQVHIAATDITAIDSYDYSIEEGEQAVFLFGPSSEQRRQCRRIEAVSDELIEETEVLRLSLSHASSEVLLNISHPHTLLYIHDTSPSYGCVEGDILLNSGPPNNNGNSSLVEMCNSGHKWESVCDTEWGPEDGATVCRQAGFHQLGEGLLSLESLQTAAATFTCSTTETKLVDCLGEKPGNVTCQHLLVSCALVTSPSTTTGGVPTVATGTLSHRVGQPAPSDSSQFPIVGVVVGVFSALLLVGVVSVVGVVSGVILWRRNRTKSLSIASRERSLEAPVYEVLEARGGTVTPTTTSSSNYSSSSATSCDLYSEIPPLSAPVSPSTYPPPTTTTLPSLPSFYDVIRPHDDTNSDTFSATGERESDEKEKGEGEGEKCASAGSTRKPQQKSGNAYEETDKKSSGGESNLYESVSDPFSLLEASGEYSTLERRRGYATLEPYTGTGGTLRLKQLGKKVEDEAEEGERGAVEDEEKYAHLNH